MDWIDASEDGRYHTADYPATRVSVLRMTATFLAPSASSRLRPSLTMTLRGRAVVEGSLQVSPGGRVVFGDNRNVLPGDRATFFGSLVVLPGGRAVLFDSPKSLPGGRGTDFGSLKTLPGGVRGVCGTPRASADGGVNRWAWPITAPRTEASNAIGDLFGQPRVHLGPGPLPRRSSGQLRLW